MKNKRLILVSCCAAAALIASPAFGEKHKKSMGASASKPQQMAARTTQVSPRAGHATRQMTPMYSRGDNAQFSGTRRYASTRYYGGSRYAGTQYYGNNGYNVYNNGYNNYYGGTRYYNGGYSYGSYPVWPYVAASVAPFVASSLWAPGYYGSGYYGYPYSSYGGYPYNYSYYGSGYGYAGSTVAAVQQRLGQLGYYRGVVDGAIGPRTRSAIAAFESTHGLVVDGTISRPLLNRLGLG